jgi:hypothetical protein
VKNFLITLILLYPIWGFAIDCPPNHSVVEYDSISGDHISFCQRTVNGSILKNGPEVHTDKSGKVIKKIFYLDGVVQKEEKISPAVKTKKIDLGLMDKAFQLVMIRAIGPLTNTNNELVISKYDRGRCLAMPLARLNFLVRNVAYTNNIKFRPNCHKQGAMRFEFDKEVKTDLVLKKSEPFEKLQYTIKLTKKQLSKNTFRIDAHLTKGKAYSKDMKNSITFETKLAFTVKVSEVISTRGREGVFFNFFEFIGKTLNGKPVVFKKVKNSK